jgi:hypothetical protein
MWRKAKKALGAGLCVRLPAVAGDWEDGVSERRASDALSHDASSAAAAHVSAPNTPAAALPGAGPLRRSKSGTKSAKPWFGVAGCEMRSRLGFPPGLGADLEQCGFTRERFRFRCASPGRQFLVAVMGVSFVCVYCLAIFFCMHLFF